MPEPNKSFPRGAAGPPQPLPKGANLALILICIVTLASVLGFMAWLML